MSPLHQSTEQPQSREPLFHLGRERIRGWVVLLLSAALLGTASCSKLRNDSNTTSGGHASTSADNSNSGQSSAAPAEGTPTTWEANATSLNGKDGETLTLSCAPGGTAHSVWGSDIYTSDSSICTAAVHSGLITYQQGGTVIVELRPGRPIYGASERNGITTSVYGSYSHSFVFRTPNTEAILREADEATPVLWNTSAALMAVEPGKTHKFKCPAGRQETNVWGTDIYTVDSSICSAAVHAGRLDADSGGTVTIELRPGESSYKGTTRNGVKTSDYGKYGQSFVVN
ncbi:MAG: LCCL domain-containing protein [Pyrinomonadaceae bacterium]